MDRLIDIKKRLLATTPGVWIEGLNACKVLTTVGVLACRHIWAPTIQNPMVRVCVKCGSKVGPQREASGVSDFQIHSCKKAEYSPRVRIRLPFKKMK